MTVLGKDAAEQENGGTEHFARIDAVAQRQRVGRIGAQIPHGGETPPRQHLLHVRGERRRRPIRRALPHSFREMDVTVPEAGNNRLSGAIDHARLWRDLNVACAADCADGATGNDNNRIRQRRGVGRGVHAASPQNQRLRARCGARGNGGTKQAKGQRGAE